MKTQKILLIILTIIVLGLLSSSIILSARWNKPLGPSLDLPTYTPTAPGLASLPTSQPTDVPSGEQSSSGATGATQIAVIAPTSTPVPFPSPTSQPLCNGPASMTILAVGSSEEDSAYLYGLADSIHVAYIDFVTPKVMVIDFPRDLWVEIPGIADHYGITHGKLNQAYFYGNPGMGYYDGPGEGPGLLARTLDYNFGLRVDHYAAIDMQTFVQVIDAVGGVDIYVDSPIDMSYGYWEPGPDLFLPVGMNRLDGKHALILARNRIPSTFQRMYYQKVILSALREKLLSPAMLPKIPGLVARFITSVQTDLTPNQVNSLICLAQAVPRENIRMDSFPREIFTADVAYDASGDLTRFVYTANFDQIRTMLADFTRGIWPVP